jgi:hypothetical protein
MMRARRRTKTTQKQHTHAHARTALPGKFAVDWTKLRTHSPFTRLDKHQNIYLEPQYRVKRVEERSILLQGSFFTPPLFFLRTPKDDLR